MSKATVNLPIFIINLQKDVEKKFHMQELCSKYELSPEFISAVDGSLLESKEISAVYSKARSIDTIGRELSLSEIGCALSHRFIYQKMVCEGIEAALVFEDDVEFCDELIETLHIIESFPSNWELVLLGHHGAKSRESLTRASAWGRKKVSRDCALVRPCELAYGTYGYLVNLSGARKLLHCSEVLAKPVDHYSGDNSCTNLYVTHPVLVNIYEHGNSLPMADRKALLDVQLALSKARKISWYKRWAKVLQIDNVLIHTIEAMESIFLTVRPVKRYKLQSEEARLR